MKTIPGVPEYIWWNGCGPTAAGMVIGWWDAQIGCGDLIEGCAATWTGSGTSGTKRIVASQAHIDAGKALGFAWGSYRNHTADCIADFIATDNGLTSSGDIGQGLVNYCAWDDPKTATNEYYAARQQTRYVRSGYSYASYCAEIDAGRPVIIHLGSSSGGHYVTGIGYDNTDGKQNYICWTTWSGWGLRSWNWTEETETGYKFQVAGVTLLTVTPRVTTNTAPTTPTSVTLTPDTPDTSDNLITSASGSTDADGDKITYQYQWAKSTDGGTTWSAWGYDGATLSAGNTAKGQQWKARARANDGSATSDWRESSSITVANSMPTKPSSVTIKPYTPRSNQDLIAAGEGSTDADGDPIAYRYSWCKSTDGGKTWSNWDWTGTLRPSSETARGECWKVRARAYDGSVVSDWTEGAPVTIGNGLPSAPVTITINPAKPSAGQELRAWAEDATDPDGDSLTYRYAWSKSKDGGKTWVDGPTGRILAASVTQAGELWRVEVRAHDGIIGGPKGISASKAIQTPSGETLVVTAAASGKGEHLAITVNLTTAAEVQAVILNLAGREVGDIAPQKLQAGINTLWWNGRSRTGTRIPQGQYLLRVQARDPRGSCATCMIPLHR